MSRKTFQLTVIDLVIGPEEANRTLFLLKRLDRSIQQHAIETAKRVLSLWCSLKAFMGTSSVVRYLENTSLDAFLL